jgi:hypothetical protein
MLLPLNEKIYTLVADAFEGQATLNPNDAATTSTQLVMKYFKLAIVLPSNPKADATHVEIVNRSAFYLFNQESIVLAGT